MNLYLISGNEDGGYDTYDSAVVRAPDEASARLMHPNGEDIWKPDIGEDAQYWWTHSWIYPHKVTVTYLGTSILDELGVVCASFNAG